jgi:hypothetical protein
MEDTIIMMVVAPSKAKVAEVRGRGIYSSQMKIGQRLNAKSPGKPSIGE